MSILDEASTLEGMKEVIDEHNIPKGTAIPLQHLDSPTRAHNFTYCSGENNNTLREGMPLSPSRVGFD